MANASLKTYGNVLLESRTLMIALPLAASSAIFLRRGLIENTTAQGVVFLVLVLSAFAISYSFTLATLSTFLHPGHSPEPPGEVSTPSERTSSYDPV